jgi:hypothetical protein
MTKETKKEVEEAKASTDAAPAADHDRVAALSRRADGTPDQYSPEIIGDKDQAIAYSQEQLRQQAVSAVDTAARRGGTTDTVVEDAPEDPTIAALKKDHDAVAEAATAQAAKEVEELHKGASV